MADLSFVRTEMLAEHLVEERKTPSPEIEQS